MIDGNYNVLRFAIHFSILSYMAKTANLYARIEPEVKEQAESILEALGIPVSNAINMFYKQIILQQGLPFDVKLPGAKSNETVQAVAGLNAPTNTCVNNVQHFSAKPFCSDTQATYNAGVDLKSYRLTSSEEPSDEMLNALMLKVRDSARESTTNAAKALQSMRENAVKNVTRKRKKMGL